MTAEQLKACTLKDLGRLAQKHGVAGWQSMAKAQLVRALLRMRQRAAPARKGTPRHAPSAGERRRAMVAKRRPVRRAAKPTARPAPVVKRRGQPAAMRQLRELSEKAAQRRNLSRRNGKPGTRDRLLAIVRDPYWLEVRWELRPQSVARAEAALAQDWHLARPTLRICAVSVGGEGSATESIVRDIEIHGGVDHWYVDVQDPPQTYRVEIGYKVPSGRFFILARSNLATTPRPGAADEVQCAPPEPHAARNGTHRPSVAHDAQFNDAELEDLFEGRLRRPMSSSVFASLGVNGKRRQFSFEVDAEVLVFGVTDPKAQVTLQGEPIRLRPDGTFTVRCSMPNCRQLIPVVARSPDGLEQRTIVLAVERNTKAMEPLLREQNDAANQNP